MAQHRPVSRRTICGGLGRGGRYPYLLHGHHRRRTLENRGPGHELEQYLRWLLYHRLRGGCGGVGKRSQCGLRGYGRARGARGDDAPRRWHVQIHRCRQNLEKNRAGTNAAHFPDRDRSPQPQYGAGGRPGGFVQQIPAARHFQIHRWRRYLEKRAFCRR